MRVAPGWTFSAVQHAVDDTSGGFGPLHDVGRPAEFHLDAVDRGFAVVVEAEVDPRFTAGEGGGFEAKRLPGGDGDECAAAFVARIVETVPTGGAVRSNSGSNEKFSSVRIP
ncbi:MAG: hypothetical protein IPN07_12205 [Dehalococcoidia bacterium]|nr:hypothetical protein [Dehalococcoidia bacterium]